MPIHDMVVIGSTSCSEFCLLSPVEIGVRTASRTLSRSSSPPMKRYSNWMITFSDLRIAIVQRTCIDRLHHRDIYMA
eukprot:40137-Eustigmatos_ZCMA.PRE.1